MKAPVSPPAAPQRSGVDLESTAELPVLDPAEVEPAVEGELRETGREETELEEPDHNATDTWVLPASARVAPVPPAVHAAPAVHPAPSAGREAELRELQANLQTTRAKLHDAEQLAARQLAQVRELEAARAEAHAAHQTAEQRAATLSEELAQARELLSTKGAQVSTQSEQLTQLQRQLEEHRADSSSELARERELQQALTAQAHAHSARLIQDLHLERARTASCLESLQTLEGRRQIAEAAAAELQREIDAQQGTAEELRGQLGGRDNRMHELESEIERRAGQLAGVEQQLTSLGAKLAEREAQLQESHREAQALQASVARAQQETAAGVTRARELEARIAQLGSDDAQRQAELERLRTERTELDRTLEAAREAAVAAAAERAARDVALSRERERYTQLEASLAAERERASELEGEVTTMTSEMETWGGVLKNAQQERNAQLDGIHAAEARARELEREAELERTATRVLQEEGALRDARIAELEAQLHAAEDSVHKLEAEVGSRGARIEALEKANEHWRATAAVAHASPAEPAARAGLAAHPEDAPRSQPRGGGKHLTAPVPLEELDLSHMEPASDGAARLLIHSDGEREIVHVLGRKTSIGRTPDNDLQIEGRYISRHHAVILAGPIKTLIEDLNSTNGVLVNGRRVIRQVLQDGDQVTIGRTLYRFAVRHTGDKH